jgi:hypothetical protein
MAGTLHVQLKPGTSSTDSFNLTLKHLWQNSQRKVHDMKSFATALISFSLLVTTPLAMADEIRTERVQFERGTSGATIKGTIKGRETMHYMIGAKAGQVMDVKLVTKSTSTYFNIFAPGKSPGQAEAMFIGDTGGDHFNGKLPDSGDYLIQVYLFRNAARKGEKASFDLKVEIAAESGASQGGSEDAQVPGTDFNATGQIPCARAAGQPMRQCDFGVKREGNGSGSITVFWPDGGNRVIFFKNNKPSAYDESEADGGAKMSVKEDNGLFAVTIGDQRFELFEAIMAGG